MVKKNKEITVLLQDSLIDYEVLSKLKYLYTVTYDKTKKADIGVSIDNKNVKLTILDEDRVIDPITEWDRILQKETTFDCSNWIDKGQLTMGQILQNIIGEIVAFPY